MKIIYAMAIAAAALSAGISTASADSTGGTTRPSYDNPRAYDRDAQGNETYQRTNTPRTGKHVKKHMQRDDD
jgi:hypothetical protein